MKLRGRLKKHTEANHMIWYLSGHFAQWCNPKQKSICFLWFALFHSGLMHCPLFRRCPKIRPRVRYCATDSESHSGCCFQLMGPEQAVVLFYFVCLRSHMYGHIIGPVLRNTEAPWCHGNTASSVHSHTGSIFLTFPASPHFATARTLSSCAMFCRHDLTTCSYFPPLHTTVHFFPPSTKVRGHRAGSLLSSWHLEVRAVRRSGAWGSASSTCRNTTSSSCWRTALSSCAPPGQTGPWPSSGSTSRGWRRFVWTQLKLQW